MPNVVPSYTRGVFPSSHKHLTLGHVPRAASCYTTLRPSHLQQAEPVAMLLSVSVCILSFICLVILLRKKRLSFGLPIAYLGSLLLIHVPGPVAYLLDSKGFLTGVTFTQIGVALAAIGAACFVVGVWFAHVTTQPVVAVPAPRANYWSFCLYGGVVLSTISYIVNIPTVGAVLSKAGPVWMLAVMLGLRSAMRRRDTIATWRWLATLGLYPLLMLLLGGFLSYGSTAAIIVLSAIAVTARSGKKVAFGTVLLVYVGISVFLGYFQNRSAIREAVWGGRDAEARIAVSVGAIRDVAFFDPSNERHLEAFDLRLNQNYFVGLAASRIETGLVPYLHGSSLWDGILAVIPRALWPEKPVEAGSPKIVAEMTGLQLSTTTSFGVGNVMEFQINFGVPGVIIGFLLLGFTIGRLDRRSAEEEAKGELGNVFLFFLPCVAIIQPNGSIVEITGGAAAAVGAGLAWRWAWTRWPKSRDRPAPASGQLVRGVT